MTEKKSKDKCLTLHQKLALIRKEVSYMQQDADGYKFKYVKLSSILGALHPKMDELDIFLEVDMLPAEITGSIVNVGIEYVWTNLDNPDDRIVKHVYLQDIAGDPKKMGGILTYALRYHLLNLFQIASDAIDLDTYKAQVEATKPKKDPLATNEELENLDRMLNGYDDLRAQLVKRCKNDITTLTQKQYFMMIGKINDKEAKNV